MLLSIRRGTTLVELMVSVGFLGVGAVALLACVNSSVAMEGYARRRALILAAAENVVDGTRAAASMGTITPGASTQSLTLAGLQSAATLTQTITLQTGYSDLYLVDVTATWNETPSAGITRTDSLELDTLIRTNDT